MPNRSSSTQEENSETIDILDMSLAFVENLRLLILMPLAVGILALGISFIITPTFIATTVFLPPLQQQNAAAALLQSLGSIGSLAGAAGGIKNPIDQYIGLLKSKHIQDKLIERFKLKERYEVDLQSDARVLLQNNTNITSGKDGLIALAAEDTDPHFAAQLANAYVQELSNLMESLAVTEAQQRRVFFERQLLLTKNQLVKAEQALQTSGVNSSALKSNPQAAVQAVAQIQAEIAAQEVKLSSMRSYLAETAPAFKLALTELTAMRAQLLKLEQKSDVGSIGDSDYVARFREFKYYETLFELFAKQFELAKVDESREGTVIQVVDIAKAPELKSKPKKALIAIFASLMTGFMLLLFVFVRQSLLITFNNPDSGGKISRLKVSFREVTKLRYK